MGPVFCLCIDASDNIIDIVVELWEDGRGRANVCECKTIKVVHKCIHKDGLLYPDIEGLVFGWVTMFTCESWMSLGILSHVVG